MGDVVNINISGKKTPQELFEDYTARQKVVEQTLDPHDGIMAAKSWMAYLDAFVHVERQRNDPL